jgi:XRE family transcriptional regulator, fatty acid utilization regulator
MAQARTSDVVRNIGRFVREARATVKESQTEFAQRIGISRGFLSEIETGSKVISINTLVLIARKLRTNPSKILGFKAA